MLAVCEEEVVRRLVRARHQRERRAARRAPLLRGALPLDDQQPSEPWVRGQVRAQRQQVERGGRGRDREHVGGERARPPPVREQPARAADDRVGVLGDADGRAVGGERPLGGHEGDVIEDDEVVEAGYGLRVPRRERCTERVERRRDAAQEGVREGDKAVVALLEHPQVGKLAHNRVAVQLCREHQGEESGIKSAARLLCGRRSPHPSMYMRGSGPECHRSP
mmetsp:Transcript_29965/g.87652  ORF Transcript_29965/g.87652 Transcript_29965/m.87652 type:complete len:222 (-) Transcript_29965:53-718(-)